MRRSLALLPALLLLAGAAQAHPGHDGGMGFAQGVAHPMGGVDHVLAMVAVGLLAALAGGRALWLLPASFMAVMAAGAGLGLAGIALPGAESAIALSLVAFGLVAATRTRLPVAALAALVASFAAFHGWAHGAEMPETASGLAYGAGFLLATALLHAVGIGVGLAAGRVGRRAVPAMGLAVAAIGAGMLVGVV